MRRILAWILIIIAILCFIEAITVHTGISENGFIFSHLLPGDLLTEGSRFLEFSAAWQSWVIVGVSLLLIAFFIAPDLAGEIVAAVGRTVVKIIKELGGAVVEVASAAAGSIGPLVLIGGGIGLAALFLLTRKGDK